MADPHHYQDRMARGGVQSGAMIDQGLRAHMLKVYNLMALGLSLIHI